MNFWWASAQSVTKSWPSNWQTALMIFWWRYSRIQLSARISGNWLYSIRYDLLLVSVITEIFDGVDCIG